MAEETIEQQPQVEPLVEPMKGNMSFTEEQQSYIDNTLIPERLTRLRKQMEKSVDAQANQEEREELTKYRQAEAERLSAEEAEKQKQAEERGEFQRILEEKDTAYSRTLDELNQALDTERRSSERMFLSNSLQSSLARSKGGILPNMINIAATQLEVGTPLLPNSDDLYRATAVKNEDSGYRVSLTDTNGHSALNDKGEDLSLDEAVELFLDRHPAFIPANVRNGGSGSHNSRMTQADSLRKDYETAMEKAGKSGQRADQNEMMRLRRELSKIEGDTS